MDTKNTIDTRKPASDNDHSRRLRDLMARSASQQKTKITEDLRTQIKEDVKNYLENMRAAGE